MSLPLADLKRLSVTPETIAMLHSVSRETGKTIQEIARGVLHEWAIEQVKGAKIRLENFERYIGRAASDGQLGGAHHNPRGRGQGG